MKEYYKKVDNETINKLMASLEENEKAIRDMNGKRGLTIYRRTRQTQWSRPCRC